MTIFSSLRAGLRSGKRACGLFLCHAPNDAVLAHFARLRRETAGLVDWTLVADGGHLNPPCGNERFRHQSLVMPRRFAAARALGRLTDGAGMMDIAIMPRALAAPHEFVWALEYDVDYSGNWAEFFRRFARNRADVLTTTLLPRGRNPDWALWGTAQAPHAVPPERWFRSFHPIMRISRRFAAAYVTAMETAGWGGHYEFTIPTIANHLGFRIADISDTAPFYHNTPADETLSPGTFVWRPARAAYFHQCPEAFAEPGKLYHPVKPQ